MGRESLEKLAKKRLKEIYGKDYQAILDKFWRACLDVDDPLGEALYYLKKVKLQKQIDGQREELTFFISSELLKELMELFKECKELLLIDENYIQRFTNELTELLHKRMRQEIKLLKDKKLRKKLRG